MKNKPIAKMSLQELDRYEKYLKKELQKIDQYRLIPKPEIHYNRQKRFYQMVKSKGEFYFRELKTIIDNGKVKPTKRFANKKLLEVDGIPYLRSYNG
jgi:Lhr-like helicase